MSIAADPQTLKSLNNEFLLLDALYPNQLSFDLESMELQYKTRTSSLCLRLENCISGKLPITVYACGPQKQDLRDHIQEFIGLQALGEPCLDAIIVKFRELTEVREDTGNETLANLDLGARYASKSRFKSN
jgi:hypothetical protein